MTRWLLALALSASIVLVAPPRGRRWAFRNGWFERSVETARSRAERRPTHGGLVVSAAIASGALLAGPSQPATRAVLAAVAIALVLAPFTDRRKGPVWLPSFGRAAIAVAVPLAGARAELTGETVTDAVLTALAVAVVIGGLATLERVDGVAPAVVGAAGIGLLVLGARVEDPTSAVAAAVGAAGLGALAYTAPPGDLRLGSSGSAVLGAALAAAAIGLEPDVRAPGSAMVPLLVLAVPAAAFALPSLAQRLAFRRLPPVPVLLGAAVAGTGAANAFATGSLAVAPAALLGFGPVLAVTLVAIGGRRPEDAPRLGRWRWASGAALLLVGVVAGIPAVLAAADARSQMQAGRELAEAGLAAAREGDLEVAVRSFDRADRAFADAQRRLDSPFVRAAMVVPGAAQNVRAARGLAEVGRELAGTATAVAERAGADDLRVVDGRFPVEAAADVGARLGEARQTLLDATEELSALDSSWLVDEVADGLQSVREAVDDAEGSIAVAAEATRLAPQLLGGGGERRWFVAILSPAELRGAGGLLGDYAVVRAVDGDLQLEDSAPISQLNAAADDAAMRAALPPVFAESYAGFRTNQFFQNLTVTPDFPTVGEAITAALPVAGLGEVGGVIGIDPYGLARLLELTGPVRIASWPDPIGPRNAAEILMFEHYNQLDPAEIDVFQSQVLAAVVDRLTIGELPTPSSLAATMAPAVAGGHLRFWSPDADEEALFARIGADGALARPDGIDHLEVLTQNGSEAKIDWFLRRSVEYRVDFDPESGQTTAIATITLANLAPAEGLAEYIIGGAPGSPTEAGENRISLTVRSALPIIEVTDAAGAPVSTSNAIEAGLGSATVRTTIPPGGTVSFTFHLAGALTPSPAYRLAMRPQPAPFADEALIIVDDEQRTVRLDRAVELRFEPR